MLIRSLLFAPANQLELLKKFPRVDADAFAIDLEDGTPENEKSTAREALTSIVAHLREQRLKGLLFVRTNDPSSPHTEADLDAALRTDIDGLVIPKLQTVAELRRFESALTAVSRTGSHRPRALIGLIETVAGVVNVPELAQNAERLQSLAFGGEDFISDIGGRRTPDGIELLYARSRVVLAAKACGLGALDQVVVDIRDDDQFRRDAAVGRNLGYTGKMCLLPRQVELANNVFSPAREEVERSRRLLAAYEAAQTGNRGVIEFEGRMIDAPLLKRARAVLELASRMEEKR